MYDVKLLCSELPYHPLVTAYNAAHAGRVWTAEFADPRNARSVTREWRRTRLDEFEAHARAWNAIDPG